MHSTRRLDPEIICTIFQNLSSPLPVHEAHKCPWYLGQICSEWRETFLSMQPYFWNEIVIESASNTVLLGRSDMKQDPARTVAILSFFLDNTRGAPFSFTLYAKKIYAQKDTAYVLPIFSKLLDRVAQWENIKMQLRQSEFLLLNCIKGRFPMLQTLSFTVQGS